MCDLNELYESVKDKSEINNPIQKPQEKQPWEYDQPYECAYF